MGSWWGWGPVGEPRVNQPTKSRAAALCTSLTGMLLVGLWVQMRVVEAYTVVIAHGTSSHLRPHRHSGLPRACTRRRAPW